MLFLNTSVKESTPSRESITAAYRLDETTCVNDLINTLQFSPEIEKKINQLATEFVEAARAKEAESGGIDALIKYYDLSSEEGVLLMCLAEALLRIPDKATENLLIRDKLTSAHWEKHIGASQWLFVNIATRGLALTGKMLKQNKQVGYFKTIWDGLLSRTTDPLIRQIVREIITLMSRRFIAGRTIEEALKHSSEMIAKGYSYSFDMLGEVARTQVDADAYFAAYKHAIQKIGSFVKKEDLFHGPSISVKLSALHPRFEFMQRETVVPVLCRRMHELALLAKNLGTSITIDSEEADRLDLMLDVVQSIFQDSNFKDWEGLGLAIQAYQKRAFPLVHWLTELARQQKKRIQVRLVKGAYWDTEIKLTQIGGFNEYPVFTRKSATDVSFLACAKEMLQAQDAIYPQFATHNAYSVAAILVMIGEDYKKYDFEFQKLQGMGEALHEQIVEKNHMNLLSRIYAPVGNYKDLLPYLVRRLLENGANLSFVNQIVHERIPLTELIENPVKKLQHMDAIPNPNIPLPKDLYGVERKNSLGIDFSHHVQLKELEEQVQNVLQKNEWIATPFHRELHKNEKKKTITNPANRQQVVGEWVEANVDDVENAMQRARVAYKAWNTCGPFERADILLKTSDLLEKHRAELMVLAVREAGKTVLNALNEVREATDFCRYYAQMAKKLFMPQSLPGPTGEINTLRLYGRGVIACISPWNFPIAIFTGQIAAALVAGNAVIAKPAEQTPLVAAKIVQLFYEAGVPKEVLQLLPGSGETVGVALTNHTSLDGILFTGSIVTAKAIANVLASRSGPIIPFIAETGGVNAMIADSSALAEQLIVDVITSAFDSAGQRCSALRVLFLQKEIADKIIRMLEGAMAELIVGDPILLKTDVGPVIDEDARIMLQTHAEKITREAKLLHRVHLSEETKYGTFIAPQAFELSDLSLATQEKFGPILHIIRYHKNNLDNVIDAINGLGYGLTFGIQSRINSTIDYIERRIQAGNIYVNRNMIGSVVGVQPFGGSRLSGTGPKAGGPHYLLRLCNESTLTINTAAVGGNATLLAMEE